MRRSAGGHPDAGAAMIGSASTQRRRIQARIGTAGRRARAFPADSVLLNVATLGRILNGPLAAGVGMIYA
jgi:hypothetical protein